MCLPTECFVCGSRSGSIAFLHVIQHRLSACKLIFPTNCLANDEFCNSDICDREFDAQVARTKMRPLPSGMITYNEAMAAFIISFGMTIGVTYFTLGATVTAAMFPVWVLSFLYPFAKRALWAPQVVLGFTTAACVLPPCVAVDPDTSNPKLPAMVFSAIFCWIVYLDLFYASQVS